MNILLEKLLIPQEDIDKYENLPNNEKLLFLYDLLKKHPNKNNLKSARDVYAGNISENGFDDVENPFIKFINNTKHDFNEDQASLIRELVENESLNPTSSWLYKPTLWDEGDQETLFKIKALTYAGNKKLQSNADKQITPESLMDNRGRIYSANTIRRILNGISVTKESTYTIKNVLERYLKDSSFNRNVTKYIKNILYDAKLDEAKANDYLNMLKNKDQFDLFLKIPVNQPTEKGMIKALKELNLKDFYESQGENKKEKSNTGMEIIKKYLKDPQVTWSEFTQYLRNTFKDNIRISQFLKDKYNLSQIRDNLVKLLNSKIDVVFDETPITVVNDKIRQIILDFLDKQKDKNAVTFGDLNKEQKDALDTLVELGIRDIKAYSLVREQPGTAEQIIERVIRGS